MNEEKVLEVIYKYQNSRRARKEVKSRSRGLTSGLTADEIAGRLRLSIEDVMVMIKVLKRKEKIESVREKYWILK